MRWLKVALLVTLAIALTTTGTLAAKHRSRRVEDPMVAAAPLATYGAWRELNADALGTRANEAEAKLVAASAPRLHEAWRARLDGPVDGAPVAADGRVFAATHAGSVYALDAASGRMMWRAPLGVPITSTPAIGNGSVIVSTLFPERLVALDASTGATLWNISVEDSGSGWSSPTISDGRVLVGTAGGDDGFGGPDQRGAIEAFDAATGQLLWRSYLSEQGGAPVWSTPAVWGGLVFAGTGNGLDGHAERTTNAIVAPHLDDGMLAWSRQFTMNDNGRAGAPDDDFGASPLLYPTPDGMALVEPQKAGAVRAVDAATGERLWSSAYPRGETHIGSDAYADGVLVLAPSAGPGDMVATNATTLRELWRASTAGSDSGVTIGADVVFEHDLDGEARAVNLTTGAPLWSARLPDNSTSPFSVADGRLLAGYGEAWDGPEGGVVAYVT